MAKKYDAVFRFTGSGWEVYGLHHAAYGFGDDQLEARADFKESLSLLLDIPVSEIELNEFEERQVFPGTKQYPAVWVRVYRGGDIHRTLEGREISNSIREKLESDSRYLRTFKRGASSLGDVIATVCFEDDLLYDLVNQVGDTDLLYVCVPFGEKLLWTCLFTDDAEDMPQQKVNVGSLGLGINATVGEFMKASKASVDSPQGILVPA